MEKTKPKAHKKGATARKSNSSHVIDLRQNAPAAKPTTEPKPKTTRVEETPAPPEVFPPDSDDEVFSPFVEEAPAPTVIPSDSNHDLQSAIPDKRFWPAFWRFLVLLVVFGVLIVGGVYVYVTYLSV